MSGMTVSPSEMQSISQMPLQTSRKEQASKSVQLVGIRQTGAENAMRKDDAVFSRQDNAKLPAGLDTITSPLTNTTLDKVTAGGIMNKSFDILA